MARRSNIFTRNKGPEYAYNRNARALQSTGGGKFAYVQKLDGKHPHLKRGSAEMVEALREVVEAPEASFGDKVREELEELGWDDVIAQVFVDENDEVEETAEETETVAA